MNADDTSSVVPETPKLTIFLPPSIDPKALRTGTSYTYFSPVPPSTNSIPCLLGVDEAGRGPVLGPMVYGVFYLPVANCDQLLRDTHHFDDSKVLTPQVRSALTQTLCTGGSDLHRTCGWAVELLSPPFISAGMLKANGGAYNLNAQAFDSTVRLVRGVMERGVAVKEVYVDTVGPPAAYQARLEREFPGVQVTVAKKADSLYACVSAASVVAKVTRDCALEELWRARRRNEKAERRDSVRDEDVMAWGSGYPSDARCVSWLKDNMHPVFGWGPECRLSWGTARELLEAAGGPGVKVVWPADDGGENTRVTNYFVSDDKDKDRDELGTWFGVPVGTDAF